jgi:hypothetical protein
MEQEALGAQPAPRKRKNGSGTAIVPVAGAMVALGTLQAATPGALVEQASAMATALAKVIETQKLYNTIQGKRHVRVEGWMTLATMLGVLPREVSVTEEWGVYTATVELVRIADGAVLSRASAECGDEAPWCDRPRYSRRSMAITRATGKVCRLAFSWIMALAGFEATPQEEMDDARVGRGTPSAATPNATRGQAADERLSPQQIFELRTLMRQAGADEGKFCNYLKIKSIADLEASRFDPACAALRKKLGRGVTP